MGFQLSPGITVSEIDLSTIIPAVATTVGGIAGIFKWGPAEVMHLIDSELTLKSTFFGPDNTVSNNWFTCANFLQYANALQIVRVIAPTVHKNSTSDGSGLLIQNEDDYLNNYATGEGAVGMWAGKYPGDLGNALGVSICDQDSFPNWPYKAYFNSAPNTSTFVANAGGSADEMHIAVVDVTGVWTGIPGQVLERFPYVSKCVSAVSENGSSIYYPNVINRQSKYVWWMDHASLTNLGITGSVNWGTAQTTTFQTMSTKLTLSSVVGGPFTTGETVVDQAAVTIANTGSGATATAAIGSNAVTSITVGAGGTLYAAAPNVVISPTSGDTITQLATATATVSNGIVTGVTVTNGGAGYVHVPLITFVVPGSGATASVTVSSTGVITAVTPIASGTAYAVAPSVTVTGPGTGASITAVLGSGGNAGKVVSYTVANGGSGYTTISGKVLGYASSVLTVQPVLGTFLSGQAVLGLSSSATGTISSLAGGFLTNNLSGGVDGNASIQDGDLIQAYDLFSDPDNVLVSLILGADCSSTVALELISLAENRQDCVVFLSPPQNTVVNNSGNEATDIISFRNLLPSTTYAFMDSGWKYMYDKYNDVYRYVPLNGDIAGLCVRTDNVRDPWWSPAGYNRGIIKNVVKLAYSPRKADRDLLYQSAVNPVITEKGSGSLLLGDKVMQIKNSTLSFLGPRRLLIVLETAIKAAAKYSLFEMNDSATQRSVVQMIVPYLRDIQGRRGLYGFQVICDSTNNTPEVINSGNFVITCLLTPERSIETIQLNMVVSPLGVDFTETLTLLSNN